MHKNFNQLKVGVLGAGQLGKMMAIAAANWHVPLHFLDKANQFPAGLVAGSFTEGDFKDFETVYQFGQNVDIITIEIEHVNVEALKKLKAEGKIIHPDPDKLAIIQDKGLQKQFYRVHQLPTAAYQLFKDKTSIAAALRKQEIKFPFVQKSRKAGYDGKGVAVINRASDLDQLMDTPSIVEEKIPFSKELAVIVARNEKGDVKAFPTVEMEFHPTANLVEYLLCPAQISPEISKAAEKLARDTIEAFDICGLLAVELFLTEDHQLLVNEVAPRPHNSGHHTIDSCYTSQFEQHLRAILNLPLGSTNLKCHSVMLNLLGALKQVGPAFYDGFDKCLSMEGVNFHLYGKATTKPFRKMGHATVLGEDISSAKRKAQIVKESLRVVTEPAREKN